MVAVSRTQTSSSVIVSYSVRIVYVYTINSVCHRSGSCNNCNATVMEFFCARLIGLNPKVHFQVEEATASVTIGPLGNNITMKDSGDEMAEDEDDD